MQAVGETASRHNTPGKLIYDEYLIVFYNIILIAEHQIVGTQCQNDIMLDLQIFRISQIFDLEELFNLFHTFCGQIDQLILFIDDEIAILFLLDTHHDIQLGLLFLIFTTLELASQDITCFIQLCGFAALSGNDQRGTRFIDQNRVNLIDDRIMQITEYKLFLIYNHVVTQIIESEFIIRDVSNIAVVSFPSFLRL